MSAILCERLSKKYRNGVDALRDVDLEIVQGQIVALVGPNGAGKTTLLKIILGFERASGGKISVLGLDPWRQREGCLSDIGYVPQSSALHEALSVDEHLELARFLRGDFDLQYARRRLSDIDVPLGQTARRLSGGQQAQLILAIALATHARLLLLDEPLASLDPLARREFLQAMLKAARTDGTTVILTSHIVTDVEEVCSNVVILGAGRVMLSDDIASARARHIAMAEQGEQTGHVRLGSFLGSDGRQRTLWRLEHGQLVDGGAIGGASLEEVVLGYLAADRAESSVRASA